MERRQWTDILRGELTRQGLPPGYVERLMGELADHAEDWEKGHDRKDAANAGADVALGTPRELARAAAAQYRGTRFAGRHPVLIFAIAPLPLFFAVEVLLALAFNYLYQTCVGDSSDFPMGIASMQILRLVLVLVPVTSLSLLLFWLVRRSAVGTRWRLVSFLLLSIVAALHFSSVDAPSAHSMGRLLVAINYPRTFLQLAQAMIPFAFLYWSCRRTLLACRQSIKPA